LEETYNLKGLTPKERVLFWFG